MCGNLRDDASDFGETRGIVMAGVVVYFPCSLEGRAELAKCVATIHAQMVLDSILRLDCPIYQKATFIAVPAREVDWRKGRFCLEFHTLRTQYKYR